MQLRRPQSAAVAGDTGSGKERLRHELQPPTSDSAPAFARRVASSLRFCGCETREFRQPPQDRVLRRRAAQSRLQ